MNILLVDDEILVRTKLKYILEMEIPALCKENAYVLCGEASNGREALDLIEKINPDIIISDMKMPVMDGLELSRCCNEKYPDIIFIALSNYDDFEYVKGTLLNGAGDYLLKHMLSKNYLFETLEKAAQEKQKRTSSREISARSIESLKSDFVMGLLTGVYTDHYLIAERILKLNMNISTSQVLPVIMWIHEYQESDLQENNIRSFSIVNIITEIMAEQKNGVVCHVGNGKYLFILSFEGIKSEKRIQEELGYLLNRIRICMRNFLEINVYYIVGTLQESIQNLPVAYRKMEKQYKNNFYIEKDIWTSIEKDASEYDTIENIITSDFEKELMLALLNCEKETVHVLLNNIFELINVRKPAEVSFKMIITRILDVVKKSSKECGLYMERVYHESYSEEEILTRKSFQSVQYTILKLVDTFIDIKSEQKIKEVSPYVQKATAYIYQHFRDNISQTDVAEYVGISSVYLSILFKKELGTTFPAFLMNVRLEQVGYCLKGGKRNMKEIAEECGFADYTYFLKSFKKKYECTPKEYIKKL